MTCIQCGDPSKYKCPTCLQPYCSVTCYKSHKQTPCTKLPDPPKELHSTEECTADYDFPTEDTVSIEKLDLLEESQELKKCLEEPYLREMLEKLDKSHHPDALFQEFMQESIFTEFVDACLKVVEPQDDT